MFRQIGTGEIIIIVVVLVLLFGSRKLPELARSIGKSARELRRGMREGDDEEHEDDDRGRDDAGDDTAGNPPRNDRGP